MDSIKPFQFLNTGLLIPEKDDPRNWPLEAAQSPITPPASHITDITPFKLPQNVYMQYSIPDCVENGVAFALRYLLWKDKAQFLDLSRRFLAIQTVQRENQMNRGIPFSQGTFLEDALWSAKNNGISETQLFDDNHQLDIKSFIGASLTQDSINDAQAYKLPSYAQVTDLSVNGLRNAIAQNGIVLIGIKISDSWWTAPDGTTSWAMSDVLPIRPPTTQHPVVSGHCVALYGYDQDFFYFMNWWSGQWGYKGHGWFGVNDLPQIYQAFVVGDFIKPTQPAPPVPVNQQQNCAQNETLVEKVMHNAEQVLHKIQDIL